jgi:hypothetical protein
MPNKPKNGAPKNPNRLPPKQTKSSAGRKAVGRNRIPKKAQAKKR